MNKKKKNLIIGDHICILCCILLVLFTFNIYGANIIFPKQETGGPSKCVFETKEDLFKSFFKDFYEYILLQPMGKEKLAGYEVNNLNDFYALCKKFDKDDKDNMPWVGNATGEYFLGFIDYCNKLDWYTDFIIFTKYWFASFRTDEGLAKKYERATDYYYTPRDTIIDICKLFYFNDENIPKFLKSKGYLERFINNIPGVMSQ